METKANRYSRRGFLGVMGMTAAASALAACSGQTAQPPAATDAPAAQATEAPPAASAAPVEISWWVVWGEGVWGDACDKVAQLHMDSHPDVTVNVLKGASTVEKLLTAVAGGVPPDCMSSSLSPDLALRDAVVQVDDMIDASGLDRGNFFDALWQRGSWKGKTYGIPSIEAAFILALSWNKNLFEESGLDPETGPTTWEELRTLSDAVTTTDDAGNISAIGFRPLDGIGSELSCWDAITGSQLMDPDNDKLSFTHEAFVAAVNWFKGFYEAYGPENMAAFSSNYGGWTGSAQAAFTRGVQGMIINGYWQPGELAKLADPELKFGYTWCPTYDQQKVQLIGGHQNVIPKGATHPQDSFDFMVTATTDEACQSTLDTAGGFLASKSFLAKVDKSKYPGLDWFIESGVTADRVAAEPNFPGWSVVWNAWNAMFEEIGFGRRGVEEGLAELEQTAQAAYDEALWGG